jgi:hypothetical protein
MFIKPLTAILGAVLCFSPMLAVADETKPCNATQETRCGNFCQAHQGAKSCIVDISKRSGTCTCTDGTSHTK